MRMLPEILLGQIGKGGDNLVMEYLHKLQVGQLYKAGVTHCPEAQYYQYDVNGHFGFLCFNNLHDSEVQSFQKNKLELSFLVVKQVIFLLLKIQDFIDWSDLPYSYHLVPEELRKIPEANFSYGTGAPLLLVLIEGTTGIIKGLRMLGLSSKFSNALHQAIQEQAKTIFNKEAYQLTIDEVRNKFSCGELRRFSNYYYRGGEKEDD